MYAVSNIEEEDLRKILDRYNGKIPIPSVAIKLNGTTHEGFGEISLIFDKNYVESAYGNGGVFGQDAYTPRHPYIRKSISDGALRSEYQSYFFPFSSMLEMDGGKNKVYFC